ncbi:MAG: VOC family protein [Gemmatimonadota bacterium]
MTAKAESTLQAKTIMPGLTVNDLQKSIAFYQGLGFAVGERWENEGVLRGAMLNAGAIGLGLSQDDGKKGRDRVKGQGLRLWLGTEQDIDALAAAAKAHGIALEKEPYDTAWESRAFDVIDPDGFALTVSKWADG